MSDGAHHHPYLDSFVKDLMPIELFRNALDELVGDTAVQVAVADTFRPPAQQA